MLPKTWTRAGKTEMPQSLLVKFQIVVQKPNATKRFVCAMSLIPVSFSGQENPVNPGSMGLSNNVYKTKQSLKD